MLQSSDRYETQHCIDRLLAWLVIARESFCNNSTVNSLVRRHIACYTISNVDFALACMSISNVKHLKT